MTIATATVTECPNCGKKGKTVKAMTVQSLLKDEHAPHVAAPEQSHCESGCAPPQGSTGWRFCESPDCDVVYFSEEGGITFTRSQLRVAVGVKERTGDRPLCYCFGHSIATIKAELRLTGRAEALEDIRRKMKDPGCRCEVTNPSGSCCLGAVTKGIRTAQEEMRMKDTTHEPGIESSRPRTNRGEKIAKVGTIVSAVMASSCCWLPLVLLAVGVSGAGIAAALEAYRPIFIVVTFAFLGAAFYFTYRPRSSTTTAADGGRNAGCPPLEGAVEDCCAAPTARKKGSWNLLAMNKIMLWIVTLLAAAFLLFPNYVGALIGTAGGGNIDAAMTRSVVTIEGMTCEGCAAIVAKAIHAVPGVLAVEVDYADREAVIGTEGCCPVPKEQILAALAAAGYRGRFATDGVVATGAEGDTADCCPVLKAPAEPGEPSTR